MKLLCIKEGAWVDSKTGVSDPFGPKYGETCESYEESGNYYFLVHYSDYRDGGRVVYLKDNFIPISEIDEKEFERNENKQLAKV